MKTFVRTLLLAAIALALIGLAIRLRYGGGAEFPDRTGEPLLGPESLELVAELDLPPGNIAVAAQGRIFVTLHPEARPEIALVEIVNGKPVPYPSQMPDGLVFRSPLSIRIDRQNRLWVLDNAYHGLAQPRLVAFDLETSALMHDYAFPREVAPIGSHLNDFQVAPDGNRIYIADASIFALRPAIVVYDVLRGTSRRVLEGHVSVTAEHYIPVVQGKKMQMLGIFAIRPGVDSIVLDRRGEWLYYAPVTANYMYRVRAADLEIDSSESLPGRVETFAKKTMSDGLATDLEGNIYITDPEHSALARLSPEGQLETLLRDDRLRWPDGLGFGPDGWLYVTCSALHQVILESRSSIARAGPYQVFRLRPGSEGVPGH